MILSFKHKGLEAFFAFGSIKAIQAVHQKRLRFQLMALHTATCVADMNIPGYKLHPMKGVRTGVWAISVSGNWRITFRFVNGNAEVVDYEDYH
jgi:proteic killer suppression protein